MPAKYDYVSFKLRALRVPQQWARWFCWAARIREPNVSAVLKDNFKERFYTMSQTNENTKSWLSTVDNRPDWGDIAKRVALLMPDDTQISGKLEIEEYDDGTGAPVFCVITDDELEVSLNAAKAWRYQQENRSGQYLEPMDALQEITAFFKERKVDAAGEQPIATDAAHKVCPACFQPLLSWSDDRPVAPGWYWCRRNQLPPTFVKVSEAEPGRSSEGLTVQLIGIKIVTKLEDITDCQWCGPIEPPSG